MAFKIGAELRSARGVATLAGFHLVAPLPERPGSPCASGSAGCYAGLNAVTTVGGVHHRRDFDMLPISGVTVRVSFENYYAEDQSHEIDTNSKGVARFPGQRLYASVARRCYYTLMAARAGVHASFGPYASAVAFGNGTEASALDSNGNVLFWRGEPSHIESRIVLTQEE
jgi:hypothetical protein